MPECNCKHCGDYRRPERAKLRKELGLEELSSLDLHRNMWLNEHDAEYAFYRWHPLGKCAHHCAVDHSSYVTQGENSSED